MLNGGTPSSMNNPRTEAEESLLLAQLEAMIQVGTEQGTLAARDSSASEAGAEDSLPSCLSEVGSRYLCGQTLLSSVLASGDQADERGTLMGRRSENETRLIEEARHLSAIQHQGLFELEVDCNGYWQHLKQLVLGPRDLNGPNEILGNSRGPIGNGAGMVDSELYKHAAFEKQYKSDDQSPYALHPRLQQVLVPSFVFDCQSPAPVKLYPWFLVQMSNLRDACDTCLKRRLPWLVLFTLLLVPLWYFLLDRPQAALYDRSFRNLVAARSNHNSEIPLQAEHSELQGPWTTAATMNDSILPMWIARHAGPSSPFHPSEPYRPPPMQCIVTQVNQLQRHGARFPTRKVAKRMRKAFGKLKDANYLAPSLEFVKTHQYHLGEASLLPLGARESFQAGVEFVARYGSLVDSKKPFLRASLSSRVVDSAHNFTAGLLTGIRHPNNAELQPLIISESPESNNTLDNNACPARSSAAEGPIWRKIFGTKIAKKLNALAPGANLKAKDALALMQLCVFESIADEQMSQFCGLFEKAEWEDFEYYYDLDKFYRYGIGSRLGGVEGVGYVAELLARLTSNRMWVQQDHTKVNQTLDQAEATFPLSRNCYIDFSHDNQMIDILTAIGLQTLEPLPPTGPPPANRTWIVSKWMPFASRLTVEKMVCFEEKQEYVRFLLNDAVLPAPFCQNHEDSSMVGICLLDTFVNSQRSIIKNGQVVYGQCHEGDTELI